MIKQNYKIFNALRMIIDVMVMLVAFCIAYILFNTYYPDDLSKSIFNTRVIVLILLACIIHIIFYNIFNLYKSLRSQGFMYQVVCILKANLYSYAFICIYGYLIAKSIYLQVYLTISFFTITLLVILQRYIIRKALDIIRTRGYNKKFIILIGTNACTINFINNIKFNLNLGYSILGYVGNVDNYNTGLKRLCNFNKFANYIKNHLIDEVIIMLDDKEKNRILEVFNICEDEGVKVAFIPEFFALFKRNIWFENFNGLPILMFRKVPLNSRFNIMLKRCMDILISIILIILLSPLMILVAIIIKLTSSGSILYSQVRVGIDRKPFKIYKFRSMYSETPNIMKMTQRDDKRCTPIGRFIRRFSIDELPQLFNVIKGDMSLIGPRPERPYYVDIFKTKVPDYMIKHYIKPGITGWAQVNGYRGDSSIEKRIEYDLYYIENWTILLDFKIIFMTIIKILFDKNAY